MHRSVTHSIAGRRSRAGRRCRSNNTRIRLGDGRMSVGRLATLANLSEFHFARMFRVSMGCSVHAWVTQQRVAEARHLKATPSQVRLSVQG